MARHAARNSKGKKDLKLIKGKFENWPSRTDMHIGRLGVEGGSVDVGDVTPDYGNPSFNIHSPPLLSPRRLTTTAHSVFPNTTKNAGGHSVNHSFSGVPQNQKLSTAFRKFTNFHAGAGRKKYGAVNTSSNFTEKYARFKNKLGGKNGEEDVSGFYGSEDEVEYGSEDEPYES